MITRLLYYKERNTIEKNSSIFAYYGSGEELSMNLWSDKPFQVIIALQQLLIIDATPDIERRVDFGCIMAIPVLQNGHFY
ncbi:hypothetical protein LOAG_14179 [Loa loa]|uniref:Uncharacterized protein n=1 Tax=Loa loa TaxID=7209 RepID=A0A1S0TIQ2_LOALO|nr:hypothetical protein LOAG_14179 [Loa loa]EFO14344.2 hypothetical protein LOAG_14179 [Loa loa]